MPGVVYLDAAASTPLAPEARAATIAALDASPANPGAVHELGRQARELVETAREQVAELMTVGPRSVVFTSGATEANNLAIRGLAQSALRGPRKRIVASGTEHPSITQLFLELQSVGFDVQFVPATQDGLPDRERLSDLLSEPTALVSVHAANNETGVMPDLEEIAEMVHESGAWLHTDASQAMAWGLPDGVDRCDLVTISSHKMYGPQGAAALVVSRAAREELTPLQLGGSQEGGLRSGTSNVAALAGFGAAATLAHESGSLAAVEVRAMRDELRDLMTAGVPGLTEHGSKARRLPNILSAELPTGFDGEVVLARTPAVAASTGSACHAGTPEPSLVLRAMGRTEEQAAGALRLSLSRYTTSDEVRRAADALIATTEGLRAAFAEPHDDEILKAGAST